MKIASIGGRLSLVTGPSTAVDVNKASGGVFDADPQSIYERWDEFTTWAATTELSESIEFAPTDLQAPVPTPRQIFAIGLNYRDHADESGFTVPEAPTVFTKFVSSVTGPNTTVTLPADGNTDWEVELVAVVGRTAHNVPEAEAWSHVAGLTVGQDLSERKAQFVGPVPQFSLGKSFPGFSPTGPWVITLDEVDDPADLELGCTINGEQMQLGRTRDLLFSVPSLIAKLSAIVTLLPGDLIFTGTPAGVGIGRDPKVFLQPGDTLVSWVDGIGTLTQTMTSA
ncbi:fumarylacetoacetate hydrolase family protein [Rhodococcus sp. IEGM 1307]|uniref:fumarylacetoacetate hydrolase family protein n=1 Tax=Rhodococcus sp. IEGM 1307 TaxID=3047091 RepID=UPI0010627C29|nr:fumarylacetoacetate hydrolase family protein [Rhodococcus sp. IEGM 1307]MDI9979454.1 fumarylacetoacetate hydrolase family protein [Rhodococcus sp. IEGM 1307]